MAKSVTANDSLGKWAIDPQAFKFILAFLPKGSTILELGSGYGTLMLLKAGYKVISIENDARWVAQLEDWIKKETDYPYLYDNWDCIQAPIVKYPKKFNPTIHLPGKNGRPQKGWYDVNPLRQSLQDMKYDLILVDGPKEQYGRGGFLVNLDLFDTTVPIIFDDVNRGEERIMMMKCVEHIQKSSQLNISMRDVAMNRFGQWSTAIVYSEEFIDRFIKAYGTTISDDYVVEDAQLIKIPSENPETVSPTS